MQKLIGSTLSRFPHSGSGSYQQFDTPVTSLSPETRTHQHRSGLALLIEHFSSGDVEDYVGTARKVCSWASASEIHTERAALALFAQITCEAVPVRLRAIQLWAIMLRYCPAESFIERTSHPDYLLPIQIMWLSPECDHCVRSWLSEVLAGAAYAFPGNTGFRAIWMCVKSARDPAEGIRFCNPLFFLPHTTLGADVDVGNDAMVNAIIMQRLVVVCEVADKRVLQLNETQNGTTSESEALLSKCISSRNAIQLQLPWAAAAAERSTHRTMARGQKSKETQSFEEQLLGMLLRANASLNDAIVRHSPPHANPQATASASANDSRPNVGSSLLAQGRAPSGAPPARQERLVPPTQRGLASGAIRPSPDAVTPPPVRVQSPPPSYSEYQHTAPPTPPTAGDLDIGHALPPSVLAYLSNRHVPRDVMYDVELALEGPSSREWLAALAQLPGLTSADCKAIALLARRAATQS